MDSPFTKGNHGKSLFLKILQTSMSSNFLIIDQNSIIFDFSCSTGSKKQKYKFSENSGQYFSKINLLEHKCPRIETISSYSCCLWENEPLRVHSRNFLHKSPNLWPFMDLSQIWNIQNISVASLFRLKQRQVNCFRYSKLPKNTLTWFLLRK